MKTGPSQPPQRRPDKRSHHILLPFRITLLVILVLITTVWSAVRLYTAVVWSSTLQAYEPVALVAYEVISGAIWTIAGAFVLWSFWRGKRHSRLAMLLFAAVFAAWAWIDRLLIQPGAHKNWPFDLLVTAVLLIYAGAVLLDPHNRIFFEREP